MNPFIFIWFEIACPRLEGLVRDCQAWNPLEQEQEKYSTDKKVTCSGYNNKLDLETLKTQLPSGAWEREGPGHGSPLICHLAKDPPKASRNPTN